MTDYGSGYRDGKRLAGLDQHLALQRKQREIDLLVEALMKEKRESARLRSGGCARDQGTTQFCAEAVALQKENERLREALRSIACTDADCSAVKPFECPIDNCIHGKARAALGGVK